MDGWIYYHTGQADVLLLVHAAYKISKQKVMRLVKSIFKVLVQTLVFCRILSDRMKLSCFI